MFKFDFKVDDADSDDKFAIDNLDKNSDGSKEPTSPAIEWYISEEVEPSVKILDNLDVYKLNSTELTAGNTTLHSLISGFLLQDIKEHDDGCSEDISKAEKNHSDLIPGVYEGGAKTWECTDDLLKFLSEDSSADLFKNKLVLDLGCGSGILGIYAYKNGARVHFQDYNKDVLENVTIPNVLLNVAKPPNESDLDLKKLKTDLQFYSGDWSKYTELTNDGPKFDVILTSETIYNPANQQKLLNTFHEKLNADGVIFLAAKTYYFGVGGGLRQFEELMHRDNHFKFETVWKSTEGVGREILELRRK